MPRLPLACLAVVLLLAKAHAVEVTLGQAVFTVPDGFTVERVAGPPLVDRPITASFDEQGRLYVADSSGSNDPVQKQLEEKPHRIVRLEDRDGDGQFDHSVVFAGKMMFPEGTLWHDGSLYVAAPPSIWRLTDTDGDGVADEREEWFEGKTLTGCANDLHGPYLGRDGWVYWCKGAFAEQRYAAFRGGERVSSAAHIFRRHPSGGPHEPVMVGGMDNPVDVVFFAERRAVFHHHIFPVPRRWPARWIGARRLRRSLRQAARRGEQSPAHWRSDASDGAPRPGSTVRPGDLRVGRVRRRLHRQPVFLSVQLEPRAAPRADSRRRDVPLGGLRFSRLDQRRLSPDRRDRGRRWQSARARHRRLVQALLPDVAVLAAERLGRDLSREKNRSQAAK